ncbi:terminase [Rodentibacter trehalosifermentans]|uniref:Terminase n=1 Tax=Rodentibacter trehalosifermentans TaxID=1908263 RepID=A0A1V3IV43_9PAST|nr:terminase small subunit [Rodentibacter trehalosifermentans]OOF45934.1 terminase [Rodentibacter trehalosifermentans]
MTTLTPKQETFCLKYIELGNASEAYRQAYNAENMKQESVHRKAAELLADGKITARIEALQAEHKERHKLTIDDLLIELEEARQIAKEKEQANAMTQATMGKAKLLGLDKQLISIEQTEEKEPIDLSVYSDDELRQLETLLLKQPDNKNE